MLMMDASETVSLQRVQQELEAVPGVQNIHHVHVWRMNEQDIHFEAHVDVEDMPVSACQQISRLKTYGTFLITNRRLRSTCTPKLRII